MAWPARMRESAVPQKMKHTGGQNGSPRREGSKLDVTWAWLGLFFEANRGQEPDLALQWACTCSKFRRGSASHCLACKQLVPVFGHPETTLHADTLSLASPSDVCVTSECCLSCIPFASLVCFLSHEFESFQANAPSLSLSSYQKLRLFRHGTVLSSSKDGDMIFGVAERLFFLFLKMNELRTLSFQSTERLPTRLLLPLSCFLAS